MLSRDLGFDRGASPDLVASVEVRAEDVVRFREARGGGGFPPGFLRWIDRELAPPHGRFARPSDDLAEQIAADSAAFRDAESEAEPASGPMEPTTIG
jgi:hypothetical protein